MAEDDSFRRRKKDHNKLDRLDSFFFAETLKYLCVAPPFALLSGTPAVMPPMAHRQPPPPLFWAMCGVWEARSSGVPSRLEAREPYRVCAADTGGLGRYLLFAPVSLVRLDDFIFNTEAHPLPVLERPPFSGVAGAAP